MEYGQKKVGHIHGLAVLKTGFQNGQTEYVAGFLVQYELAAVARSAKGVILHFVF